MMREIPPYLEREIELAWSELTEHPAELRLTLTGKILGFLDDDGEEGVIIGSYTNSIPLNVFASDVQFVYSKIMEE